MLVDSGLPPFLEELMMTRFAVRGDQLAKSTGIQ